MTQAEWAAVMGTNLSWFRSDNEGAKVRGLNTSRFPVENVNWDECQQLLRIVNARVDKPISLRLPHEDQWEYACRGGLGNTRPFYFGSVLNGSQANTKGSSPYGTTDSGPDLDRPCAVDDTGNGKYEPHPWGLMHMHGNVWEWCDNVYEGTQNRVLRGGSWAAGSQRARSANRYAMPPATRTNNIGFRLVAFGL